MELPRWSFKAMSRPRRDGSIDMVFRLRPLGRFWFFIRAIGELIRTTTITITIAFREPFARPYVHHDGEVIEPEPPKGPTPDEILQFVRSVEVGGLDLLIQLAQEQKMFVLDTPRRRA